MINAAELVAISEAVAAIAVVGSLVYLTVQVRQNTVSVRSATVHSVSDTLASFTAVLGGEAGSLELYVRGLADDSELTQMERLQFDFLLSSLIRRLENAFLQFESGLVEEAQWHGWSAPLRVVFSLPGGERWWREWSPFIGDGLRQYVTDMLDSNDLGYTDSVHPLIGAIASYTSAPGQGTTPE